MMQMMASMWEKGGGGKGWGGGGGGGDKPGNTSKPGDWVCPSCSNVNWSSRAECNKCGHPRGNAKRLNMKEGDWVCHNCGDLVFASKSVCKMCGTPKPEGEEGYQPGAAAGSSRYSPY